MRKEELYNYLDSIAEEAKSLATVWQSVYESLGDKPIKIENNNTWRNEFDKFSVPNAPYYARLATFYDYLTVATKGDYSKKHRDNFVSHLSVILYIREATLKEYRNRLKKINSSIIVATDNPIEDIRRLSESVLFLHKEAAALEVLAKTIRTMKD